jgi:hypothetical protein
LDDYIADASGPEYSKPTTITRTTTLEPAPKWSPCSDYDYCLIYDALVLLGVLRLGQEMSSDLLAFGRRTLDRFRRRWTGYEIGPSELAVELAPAFKLDRFQVYERLKFPVAFRSATAV